MSGIDPIEALEDVTRAIYLATARVPPLEAIIEADVAYGSMHVAVPPLNAVFAARFTEANADARIDDVLAWYAARSMPPFWWVGPADTPVDLPERLLAKGLMEDETVPGMAADLTAVRDESPAPDITVERVRDDRAYAESCDVLVEGFGMPTEVGAVFARLGTLGYDDDLPLHTFVARLDGRAVGTSLGVISGRTLGLFNVVTLAQARGRGVGRAVTLAAMRDGAVSGCELAVLQSSSAGHSVYERLGFRDFAAYRTFVRSAPD